jgi:hypothetical protein
MTKNVTGGNKSKKFARKHTNAHHESALVLSTHVLEKYAIVTKMLGNGMFYATTYDGHKDIIGHIRNKFKGRSKHGNMVAMGSFILLGFREWEEPNFKQGDLIHVYQPTDFQMVANYVNITSLLALQMGGGQVSNSTTQNTDNIVFQHDAGDAEEVVVDNTPAVAVSTAGFLCGDGGEQIDIDDI